MFSVSPVVTNGIVAVFGFLKYVIHLGMTDRQAAIINLQVLLRYVGDILSVLIFSEQMIKRLIFVGSYCLRYGLIPFFRIIIF